MIRFLFALLLLIMGCPLFPHEYQNPIQDWRKETILHLSHGNLHLMSREPWQALEEFQKAKSSIDKSESSSLPIDFMITFGQVIAYDCLGFHDHCKQAIGSMYVTVHEYFATDDEVAPDKDSYKNPIDEAAESIQFLQYLVSLSPTLETRNFLFSIVDEIAEAFLPEFEFADSIYLGNDPFNFDDDCDNFSIDLCKHKKHKRKSGWEKFKHFLHEAGEIMEDAWKAIKTAKDVWETVKKWLEQNQSGMNNGKYYD